MNALHGLAAVGLLLSACSGAASAPVASPPSEPSPTATPAPTAPASPPSTAVTATPLFAAYGGVGIVPDPIPPDYDTSLAVIVVAIDNPGAARTGVSIASGALVDASGASLASMRHVVHAVVLETVEEESAAQGSFAVYLNPEGTPFDGTLPTGRTILRVRFALDRDPFGAPALGRITLDGAGDAPLVIDAAIDGAWATS